METEYYIAGTELSQKAIYTAPRVEMLQTQASNLLQNFSFDVSGDFEEYPEGNIYDMNEI